MSGLRAIFLPLACGLIGFAAPGAVAAEKSAPASAAGGIIYPRGTETRAEPSRGRGSAYTSMLVVALLLAGAGGWLFWRGRRVPGAAAAVRKLAITETKSLGNRQYLVVTSYEGKKFLLGVCPGRIDLLTPLDGVPPSKIP
jgi:flagellar protein FliO/FliZ